MLAAFHDDDWLRAQFPKISSLTPLASGGQKWAYTGRHEANGDVVLKVFHPDADPSRAIREIEAVNGTSIPRVPHIFESGTIDYKGTNLIWVCEQRVPGRNLRAHLAAGPLPAPAVMIVAAHVLEAIAAAENIRIVHRDIKPENIMLHDAPYSAWLLDFGIARHLDLESITLTAKAFGIGTAGYAPPEQFRNRKSEIDSRADLFSLGVTLYECIEGTNPLRDGARDVLEIFDRTENRPLPPITRTIDSTGQLRQFIVAMTRPRRDHRIPTAADALRWLEEIRKASGHP